MSTASAAARQFPDEQRDQAGRAAAEGKGDERQAVDGRGRFSDSTE